MAFKKRQSLLFAALIFGLLVSGNRSGISQEALTWAALKLAIKKQFPTVTHITTQELSAWLARSDTIAPILLDARTDEEFQVSHLIDAKLAVSVNSAISLLRDVTQEHPIVVYCSVGYRSSQLATKLQEAGYKNAQNLDGSIFQWANEGRPVYSRDRKVEQVHPFNRFWGQLLKPELWHWPDKKPDGNEEK